MLHWICPECGRECEPKERDCPACYPETAVKSRVEVAAKSAAAKSTTTPISKSLPPVESRTAVMDGPQTAGLPEPGLVGARKAARVDSVLADPLASNGSLPHSGSVIEGQGGVRV